MSLRWTGVDPGGEGSISYEGLDGGTSDGIARNGGWEGLELAEATDDLQTSGEVLGHGLHFQVEGYAEIAVALADHVAGLHPSTTT